AFIKSFNSAMHNALQPANAGGNDAFVAKLNAAGDALVYLTWLGGSADDVGYGIAVDGAGNAYVARVTHSVDFPTANPLQATNKSCFSIFASRLQGTETTDAFVAKLNAAGTALVYSTYLGGISSEGGEARVFSIFGEGSVYRPTAIAVDSDGNAYVAGTTGSTDFPTVNPLQATFGGYNSDAYVAKLSPDGSALLFSTYLGGSQTDRGNALALDADGGIYVAGVSYSADFPTANAFQGSLHGSNDAFVARIQGPQTLRYAVPDDGQPHTLVLGVGGATLQLLDNGSVVRNQLLANSGGVVVTAAGSALVVLSVDNSAGLIALPQGVRFDGGPGSDVLLVTGTPGVDALTLTPAYATLNDALTIRFTHVQFLSAFG